MTGNWIHFKTTLSALVIGKRSSFFIKRGDSPIVVFVGGVAQRIGVEDSGAWAGQVAFFSSAASHDELQWGVNTYRLFSDAMICSDGFGDLTVHRVTDEVNPVLTELLISDMRAGTPITARLSGATSPEERSPLPTPMTRRLRSFAFRLSNVCCVIDKQCCNGAGQQRIGCWGVASGPIHSDMEPTPPPALPQSTVDRRKGWWLRSKEKQKEAS